MRIAVAMLGVLAVAAGPERDTDFGQVQPARPAGGWRLESMRRWDDNGKPRADTSERIRITFHGPTDMEICDTSGRRAETMKYGLKVLRCAGDVPGQLDVTIPGANRTAKLLYRYLGDRLQLAVQSSKEETRPARFSGKGVEVMTFAPLSGRLIDPQPRWLPPKPTPKPATK